MLGFADMSGTFDLKPKWPYILSIDCIFTNAKISFTTICDFNNIDVHSSQGNGIDFMS